MNSSRTKSPERERYHIRLIFATPFGPSLTARGRIGRASGITNDPNRADDPTYILRLIGQVIAVSLETVKIVRALPPLGIAD